MLILVLHEISKLGYHIKLFKCLRKRQDIVRPVYRPCVNLDSHLNVGCLFAAGAQVTSCMQGNTHQELYWLCMQGNTYEDLYWL